MGTLDSREYDRLVERGFKPYSAGHRRMYEKAMATMYRDGPTPARVLEAGFGIGYGLDQMVASLGLLKSYVGYEPNKDAFDYVHARYPMASTPRSRPDYTNMLLLNLPFRPNLDPAFDYAVCIEVIEHVPMEGHLDFLRGLCAMAPVLCFSTPDIVRQPREGVRAAGEWLDLLTRAGYVSLVMDASEWTNYYEARR